MKWISDQFWRWQLGRRQWRTEMVIQDLECDARTRNGMCSGIRGATAAMMRFSEALKRIYGGNFSELEWEN